MSQFKIKLYRTKTEETEVLVDAEKIELAEKIAIENAKVSNYFWADVKSDLKVGAVKEVKGIKKGIHGPEQYYG